MKTYQGFTVSRGTAIGRIVKKREEAAHVIEQFASDPECEIRRLKQARQACLKDLEVMRENAVRQLGEKNAEIFEAHEALLEDDYFFEDIEASIREGGYSAEWAARQAGDTFIASLGKVEDEYIAERTVDIQDIFDSLLRAMSEDGARAFCELPEHTIYIAKELTPSDTMNLDLSRVDAFVVEHGGKNSHVAIIARAAGKAALIGAEGLCDTAKDGDEAALDGEKAEVYLAPDEATLKACRIKIDAENSRRAGLRTLVEKRAETADGHAVELFANIAVPEDIGPALENGAAGVGLFRTEFLYINRKDYPTEEEQFEKYRGAAETLQGKPLIVRTMDVGGDKTVDYFQIPKEENPFLGYRAIRICLDRRDLFKTQLRAILRASVYGDIRIMFPMISGVAELRAARAVVREVQEELKAKNIPCRDDVQVGTMIEIPSAAVLAERLADECDFFSIGTNDLVQYTLAADRGNANVAGLYSPFHPAVLSLIRHVAESGCKKGKMVGVCGEAAADVRLLPVLLGMGVGELSVAPASLLKCKEAIRGMTLARMKELSEKVLAFSTAEETEAFLEQELGK